MRFYKFLSPSYLNIIALSNLQLIFGRFSRFNVHKIKCFEMRKNDKDVYKLIKVDIS